MERYYLDERKRAALKALARGAASAGQEDRPSSSTTSKSSDGHRCAQRSARRAAGGPTAGETPAASSFPALAGAQGALLCPDARVWCLHGSHAAFLEALNAAHYPLALYPSQQVRTDSFSQAFFDYLRAIDRPLSMPSLLQQRPDLQVQHPVTVPYVRSSQNGYVHCVAGDAFNKPSSYAGVATRDLEQHADTYLDRSGLEGAVQKLHGSGQLNLAGAFAAARATTEATGAGADAVLKNNSRCSAALHLAVSRHGSASDEGVQMRGLRGPHEQRRYSTQVEQLTNDVHEFMSSMMCMSERPEQQGLAHSKQRH
ncbi:hypothetical protein HaLaN_12545 [Haematococcus lacustris]|uniref:Uncharacterized protein n=1 Tax=Haematococcus lacustris TaxID=44745 RepID=A0A699ZBC0_HAELA|nr:hypothetical protein HaLaN_12545 [Haematococcus lacustris]